MFGIEVIQKQQKVGKSHYFIVLIVTLDNVTNYIFFKQVKSNCIRIRNK